MKGHVKNITIKKGRGMYRITELQKEYKKKLITAEQAAEMVKPGNRLHFGLGCGSIVDIDKAIAKRADELKNITVISTVAIREKPFETFTATKSNDQVRFASAHFSGNDRHMSQEGRCWYIPMMYIFIQCRMLKTVETLLFMPARIRERHGRTSMCSTVSPEHIRQ